MVNWQSFSIGAGARVDIDQPTSTSTMLNRVTGSTKSTISGQLNANGQVFLVNPNGIAISKTGKVSAAGFVGSSLDISDDDFKAGKLKFKGKGASAAVANEGAVSIGRGGYAALIGGSVDNAGSITVPLGKVGLGSGEQAALDLSGDGFLQVSVPTKADGGSALVSNSGIISADGGTVELKAAAVRDAARQAVNMSGVVEARTVSGQSGAIVLGGGEGTVEISGTLDASAKSGGKGGKVTVTGRKLKLKHATVDASGKDGGGTIKIGGDKQGSGTLQHADTTTIDADSTISADATGTGNGGTVIVWSDEQTRFAGKISARGGDIGGNGGFTEVSGKQRLDFTGSVDLRARFGDTGDLLLDPYNVTISNGTGNTGGSMDANTNDSVINVTMLQNLLATANVTISTGSGGAQAGDITVAAPISWNANTLTLNAHHSIVFNAGATIGGVGGLTLVNNNGGTGGVISYALGASATFTGTPGAQALSINGQSYTLIYDVNGLQSINSGLNGRYALANTIEASATYYWNNLLGFTALGTDGNTNIQNGGNGFNGTFDGLGHIINQIWVRQIPANYVGLFGYVGASGVVRNVGLVDAYISGSYDTGAIAGWNKGTISGVWASGYLQGVSGSGGLVGFNEGSITRSFSTVAVQSRDSNNVGGIAGYNSGTISQVYASGSVLGGDKVGGLVGFNAGALSDGYSTGAVNGTMGGTFGGSVGFSWGTVTNVYFDITTSGMTTGVGGGTAGVTSTGLTTAQLQGSGATGLSAAFSGGSTGLYPYLKSFYPNGVQAISGIAYKDNGVTPLSSGTRQPYYVKNPGFVTGVSNGVDIGTVTTGVNGYYYIAVPTGWITDSVLAYTVRDPHPNDSSGARNGVTFRTGLSGGNVANLNVYGDWRLDEVDSSMTSLSALQNASATTVGSTYVGSLSFANWQIETAATTFALDQAVSIGAGTLVLSSNGTVTQTDSLAAASLVLGGSGGFNLSNAGNQIGTVAANAGSVNLVDQGGLVIGSVTSARGALTTGSTTTGSVKLQTTGDLTIAAGAKVSGTNPVLAATGKFINSRGSDAVSATSGSWLVYAANPTGNTFGNLDSGNTAIWNTAAGGAVSATGNRYVFNYQPTLTFTSTNASKVYGDAMPTLAYSVSGYQAGVANAYLGDSATTAFSGAPMLYTPATLATQQLGAGTYTITFDAGNVAGLNGYALAFNSTGLLSVAKRAVTVTADAKTRAYGDADPALTYQVTTGNLVDGDTLYGALATGATTLSGVGSYGIIQGSLANANYDITYQGSSLTVGKRAVTVTADAKSRVYGDANPALTYQVTTGNLVNGDSLSGLLATSATNLSGVGGYGITQGTLTNVANANYDITYQGSSLTVGKRAVTVTADAKSRIYGDANPALTYQVTTGNLVDGDTLSGALATDATTLSGVGSYGITQGTLANANYDITYSGNSLTVGKRAVTVTADAKSRIYGDANPALTYQLSAGNLVNNDSFSGALAATATASADVGTYGITQGSLANANYDITYEGSSLTVGKRAVTVTASGGQGKVYGNTDPSSYGYASTDLGSGAALAGALSRASGEDVGSYAIGRGTLTDAANANYDITYVGAGFSIGKRAVTVTANSGQGKTYGNADPLTYGYSFTDLGTGSALVGDLARASGEGAGSYAIGRGTLTDAANANYDITYVGAGFSIGKRAITVVADAKSRPQGTVNPALTYTVGGLGLVNGDTFSGVLSTDATPASAPGSYAIEQGSLAISANYELTYVGADLIVSPPNTIPTGEAASTVAYNTYAHGGGRPAPVFFTGAPADSDTQTLIEDPRLDGPAFCQTMGDAASVCAGASVQ
ncbi:MBG domain-containing protein [Mesorhizobium sp. INR15]|uniref:MBG domain-containing protein n=1 Tax=Mesorhizobium sp. INR15 TaxID=2654248 RepID=UPI0021565B12